MRVWGVTYDTGFINNGVSTRESFSPAIVKREMEIIRNDLHCNGVRITGGDPGRLETAARLAAGAGLEVWYCPFTCNLTIEGLREFLVDAATRAERIRTEGYEVVFVTGSEITLFTKGFFSNEDLNNRLDQLKDPTILREKLPGVRTKLKAFMAETIPLVRDRFHGKITYASIPFEGVDWSLFDIIATDGAYRTAANAAGFKNGIRSFVSQGKPFAVTEFGCGTYSGAADNPVNNIWMIDWVQGKPDKLNGHYLRNEREQADYMLELFRIFDAEGVDAAFFTSFAAYNLPHREDPIYDLDIASYGIVTMYENRLGKAYPDMPWEPKEAFKAISEYFSTLVP